MRFDFLRQPPALIVAALLVAQAAVFYTMSHGDAVPLQRPLAQFPGQVDTWALAQENPIDQESRELLGADDYLNRVYVSRSLRKAAGLYVAYWQSQQTGQSPHSPKNCLPGSGWVPSLAGILEVPLPGSHAPIRVNQYVVSKGNDKALVLYWYQSHDRIIASEYTAKVYTVLDSLRYHRSDTALVRIFVNIPEGHDEATRNQAISFIQSIFPPLCHFLPA